MRPLHKLLLALALQLLILLAWAACAVFPGWDGEVLLRRSSWEAGFQLPAGAIVLAPAPLSAIGYAAASSAVTGKKGRVASHSDDRVLLVLRFA